MTKKTKKLKSLKVKYETWKKVMQIKLDKDLDSVDDAVKHLVENEGY